MIPTSFAPAPPPYRPRHRPTFACAVALALWVAAARAHEFTITDTLLILKSDHTFLADLRIDVDALIAGVAPSTPAEEVIAYLQTFTPERRTKAEQDARTLLARRVRIHFDDQPAAFEITFPDAASSRPTSSITEAPAAATSQPSSSSLGPTLYGLTARLSGRIPADAKTVRLRASRAFNALHLTIFEQSTRRVAFHIVPVGDDSPPFKLTADPRPNSAATGPFAADQPAASATSPASTQPELDLANTLAPSTTQVALEYARLGFEHILPEGLDHILFVLALFLLSTSLRPLLLQITAFTVAHCLTLALAIYQIVRVESWFVESAIAASIAYVAIENLATTQVRPHRLALVFGFGLLHGLGFAGVLTELGIPRGQVLPALLSFNLGVEAGQLAVVAVAMLTVGWFRTRPWYRTRIVLPLSAMIAVAGLFWSYTRLP